MHVPIQQLGSKLQKQRSVDIGSTVSILIIMSQKRQTQSQQPRGQSMKEIIGKTTIVTLHSKEKHKIINKQDKQSIMRGPVQVIILILINLFLLLLFLYRHLY
jgi:hypothetical protein